MHAEDSQAIEEMIRIERDAIVAMIDERLVPLLLRRAMSRLVRDVASRPERGGDTRGEYGDAPKDERRNGPAPRHRSKVAQVILDRLWMAPGMRLTGAVLNAAVVDSGYGLDAAQKVKTRMGRAGILRREAYMGQSTWVLAQEYRRSDAVLPGLLHDAEGRCPRREGPTGEG